MRLIQYLPRFKRARREMDALAQREAWSRGDIERYQLERLNAVWMRATRHVEYYRRLAAEHRLPQRFQGLDEFKALVPVLSKAAVRERPQDFLSEQAAPGSWQRTGGSTGLPMGIYWGKEAHLEILRGKYRMLQMWDVDLFDRQVYLWGHGGSFAPGLAGLAARAGQPLRDRLRNRLRLSAYRMGQQDLTSYLKKLRRFRAISLYGYSTAVYLLACEAGATDFQCDSLRLIVMSGEPAYPEFVQTAQQALAAPVAVEYGATECAFIAGQCPDGTLRVREDLVLLETVARPDGLFDIVVTVLGNPSFPLMRYAIDDVTDAPLHSPATGFSVLNNVRGRNNDLVVSRSGRFVHAIGIKHVFEHLDGVRRFRAWQREDGHLFVSVESDKGCLSFDPNDVASRLQDMLEGYPITIETVDAVLQTRAGKHRWVTSDLAARRLNSHSRPEAVAAARGGGA
jgi:phenylacetate-CoA ligase